MTLDNYARGWIYIYIYINIYTRLCRAVHDTARLCTTLFELIIILCGVVHGTVWGLYMAVCRSLHGTVWGKTRYRVGLYMVLCGVIHGVWTMHGTVWGMCTVLCGGKARYWVRQYTVLCGGLISVLGGDYTRYCVRDRHGTV